MHLYPTTPAPLSMVAAHRGVPLSTFNGHRLICAACFNPFRCFRAEETHCGCCRDLKLPPGPRLVSPN